MICSDCLNDDAQDYYICDGEYCDMIICNDCIIVKDSGKYCYSCSIEQPPYFYIGATNV